MVNGMESGERFFKVNKTPIMFWPLNFILSFNGFEFDFDVENGQQPLRHKIRRKVTLICFWLFLLPSLYIDSRESDRGVADIFVTQVYISASILQISLLLNRQRSFKFITFLGESLSKQEKQTLSLMATLLLLKFMIMYLRTLFSYSDQFKINRIPYLRADTPHALLISDIILSLEFLFYDVTWVSMSIYIICVFLTYFYIERRIKIFIRAACLADEKVMMNIASHIIDTFDTFESNFSFLPFIGLSVNFSQAVYHLVLYSDHKVNHATTYLTFSLFHQLFTCFLVSITSILSEKISKHKLTIIRAYYRGFNGERMMNNLLLQTIHEAFKFQFTVWNVAKIDRGIVLTYISTVVTFSALIYQFKDAECDHHAVPVDFAVY